MELLNQFTTQPWLALMGVILLGLAIVIIFLFYRIGCLRRQQQQELDALQSDMRALVSAAVGVGERVHRLEKSLREVSHRQEVIDQADPGAQAYQQAIKMAQKGASTQELIDICGLTKGEADLIAMLHRMERRF